ncbi:hypothetical protein VTO42DRAFT_89 [Malbranchea cinnamomea]
MATTLADDNMQTMHGMASGSSTPSGTETPQKLKGHQRLLNGLQRMASSPSLVRRNRTRSSSLGSWRISKASMSCASLSSTLSSKQCWGDASSSKLSGSVSTRAVGSHVAHIHGDEHTPVRIVPGQGPLLRANIQTSVPLPADVRPSSRGTPLETTTEVPEGSQPVEALDTTEEEHGPRWSLDFWHDMPPEIRMSILKYLTPLELVSCSRVSRSWYAMCFDGQLWASLDASTYYTQIPRRALVRIILAAGPFLRTLNLRGCIQMEKSWREDGERMSDACRNLTSISLEDCRIDKATLHSFLAQNSSLTHVSMRAITAAANTTLGVISHSCPNLEYLNVSWCRSIDTRGLVLVVKACRRLRDLRVSEVSGFDNQNIMQELFEANTLERLLMSSCTSLNDASLKVLVHGKNPEIDPMTDRPKVPPRKLRHLDLSRCRGITDTGVKYLAHVVPDLEILQLSHCTHISDEAVAEVIRTTPRLTQLELEEMEDISNDILIELSKAPCAATLENLNLSYCEKIGDLGMLPLLKNCPNIRSLDLDNTRVSDLTIMELCDQMRRRGFGSELPKPGLRVAVFDCGNVTWAGVREILCNNTYVPRLASNPTRQASDQPEPCSSRTSFSSDSSEATPVPEPASPVHSSATAIAPPVYPKEIIQLKCFYGWQMTVDEHTKRVLRGNLTGASRLERKWADYMMATQEASVTGSGARRRRRRARDAEANVADDDDGDDAYWYGPGGLAPLGGRRRRARSGGCVVM